MESCSEMAAAFEISPDYGDVRELPSFAFPSHRWLTGLQSRIVHHDHKEKPFLATAMPVGTSSHFRGCRVMSERRPEAANNFIY